MERVRSSAHAQTAWRTLPVGTVKVNAVFGRGPELLDEMTAMKPVHLEPHP